MESPNTQFLDIFKRLHVVMNNANFPDFNLKPKQVFCLENLFLGKDVIAVLPTGFGKSYLFHALPDLFPEKLPGANNIVLVLCPLNSILEDQITVLTSQGIAADVLRVGTEGLESVPASLFDINEVKNRDADGNNTLSDNVSEARIKILLCHPEAILSNEGRNLMKSECYQKRVVAWVVDEAHCIKIW